MVAPRTRFTEIILRTVPAKSASSRTETRSISSYDVLVYADQPPPIFRVSPPPSPSLERSREMLGMPLVAVERLEVHWRTYEEFLADFLEGEKTADLMRDRLLGALSPGLEALFGGRPIHDQPIRVRWLNDSPELEDIPWDLLARARRGPASPPMSFVRSVPPQVPLPPTILPQGRPLRVGLIGDPMTAPSSLREILSGFVALPGPPRAALQRAATEGFEVLHLIADGQTSLGFEGLLSFPSLGPSHGAPSGPSERPIPPSELASWVRGTGTALICLSPANCAEGSRSVEIGGHFVPSVYRAFAYLGTSRQTLPSFVAPLGPIDEDHASRFWREFYDGLRDTLNAEEAMIRGQRVSPSPMALFLRHPHGQLFREVAPEELSEAPDLPQLGARLQSSREMVKQLMRVEKMFGSVPQSIADFLQEERGWQERIQGTLSRWMTLEDEP